MMTDVTLHERAAMSADWATVVFVVGLALLTVTRVAFENRFLEFSRLAISDKYIKIYRDSGQLVGWFTIALFLVQVISFAFLIQLAMDHFGYADRHDWMLFIRLSTFVSVFILAKFLIEKIIATSFHIEEFVEQFNLYKISYRTYLGMILLPIDAVLFYHEALPSFMIYALFVIIIAINGITYLSSLKTYQNLIVSHLFYFILYLCALEIAPYYFLYYWFTKS
ncbi:MAG TPA: DUF4271 domain-containing protein [Flavobacterium sp.]|nr:DUF4271 domain-containing protein [Flavobacterium sp.]